jgi:hypothetical protein
MWYMRRGELLSSGILTEWALDVEAALYTWGAKMQCPESKAKHAERLIYNSV